MNTTLNSTFISYVFFCFQLRYFTYVLCVASIEKLLTICQNVNNTNEITNCTTKASHLAKKQMIQRMLGILKACHLDKL